MTLSGQTICLCMIVKDEAVTIRRCLDSVRNLIDHWLVVDLGSTDGTPSVVRRHLHDIPGELIERPFQDFAHNRSEAISLARPHGDYSLLIDADESAEIPDGFELPDLDLDYYTVDAEIEGCRSTRIFLVKASLVWRYDGVVFEYLAVPNQYRAGHLAFALRASPNGARRRGPESHGATIALVEKAIEQDVDPFKLSRYVFNLAQLYKETDREKAVALYRRRSEMKHWDQEVFCSLLYAGRIMQASGYDPDEVLGAYMRATEVCPFRSEALHAAAQFCRSLGRFGEALAFARSAAGLPIPATGLFLETWIYAYGALDELAANSYWTGRYRDCLDACMRALETGNLPAGEQSRFLVNMRVALEQYGPNGSASRDRPFEDTPRIEARSAGLDHHASQPGRPWIHICFISINSHDGVFDPIVATLAAALESSGCHVTISKNRHEEFATNIVIGSIVFAAKKGLLSFLSGKKYQVYQLEQLSWEGGHVPSHGAYLDFLRQADRILEYSPKGMKFLESIGIETNVTYLPPNFHRSMISLIPSEDQDIDVLFYGTSTGRRERIILQLRSHGLAVEQVFGVYGRALDALIARSKIIINIHAWDELNILETVRLAFLIANRCFVISEFGDHDPYGSTIVYAAYADLTATCIRYLRLGRAERDRIASAAFARFSGTDFARDIGGIFHLGGARQERSAVRLPDRR